jgi:hypothetical protein
VSSKGISRVFQGVAEMGAAAGPCKPANPGSPPPFSRPIHCFSMTRTSTFRLAGFNSSPSRPTASITAFEPLPL